MWVDDAEIDVSVDIDLERIEDSIAQMNARSNDVGVADAARNVVAQRRMIRPKATVNCYRKGLVCWTAFCARRP